MWSGNGTKYCTVLSGLNTRLATVYTYCNDQFSLHPKDTGHRWHWYLDLNIKVSWSLGTVEIQYCSCSIEAKKVIRSTGSFLTMRFNWTFCYALERKQRLSILVRTWDKKVSQNFDPESKSEWVKQGYHTCSASIIWIIQRIVKNNEYPKYCPIQSLIPFDLRFRSPSRQI